MMKSLKSYQNSKGLWNQLVDEPDCWTETWSGYVGVCIYNGSENGWLDSKEYAPAARKAWLALVPYINDNNEVTEVCIGTDRKNDKQYYYDRKRCRRLSWTGSLSLCAVALMEK